MKPYQVWKVTTEKSASSVSRTTWFAFERPAVTTNVYFTQTPRPRRRTQSSRPTTNACNTLSRSYKRHQRWSYLGGNVIEEDQNVTIYLKEE